MTKQYTPRAGSYGDRAIQIIKECGPQASPALATALDCSQHNLTNNLALCVKHGLIKGELIKNCMVYSLGDGTAPAQTETETEDETQAEPFSCGLYSDGDLALVNAGHDGDINCILPKAQVYTLVRYLLSFDSSDLTDKPSAAT